MKYTPEEMEIATRTARHSGAVGSRAIVPRIAMLYATKPGARVLDYGSGKYAIHTQMLREHGIDTVAHDFGKNFNPEIHDPNALDREYDLVFASNVLNVQSSQIMLKKTLDEIYSVLVDGGVFICNYPRKPRKLNISTVVMEHILSIYFSVTKVTDVASPTWICVKLK